MGARGQQLNLTLRRFETFARFWATENVVMKIRSTIISLSIFALIMAMGCADNPTGEPDADTTESTFLNADTQVAMAPQQPAGDQPSARLLAFSPEFFPDGVEHSIPLDEIFHGGPRKDGIPALTNPKTIPAEAADYLRDIDIVLGMTINGESRAYPLRILNWHEITNDTLGGRRIVVTFCPLCGTGIVLIRLSMVK